MFKKLHEAVMKVSGQVHSVNQGLGVLETDMTFNHNATICRLESIETWLELAVDAKADEVAERFEGLLAEFKGKPVNSDILKELVRQAVKGH